MLSRKVAGVIESRAELVQGEQETVPEGPQLLRERAYGALRQRINTLYYRPGAYLNETMICTDLGIGRTPVHMALERLALEGLVEILPRKGVIVASISFDEMKQVNETRRLVEPPAAALAARWATDAEVERMCDIVRQAREVPMHDTESLMNLDSQLHNTLADATRNRILAAVLKGLHEKSLRNWYISLSDRDQRQRVADEHDELIEAIVARDPDEAQRLMAAHIDSFKQRVESVA